MALKTTNVPVELRPFWKIFDRISYRHDYSRVFDNFITMALTQFTPPGELVDQWHEEAMRGYSEEEKALFNEAFQEFLRTWVGKSEAGWYDFPGNLYEAITSNFKSSKLGQFFTPGHICDVSTQLMGTPNQADKVNDPACGSGRMLLAHYSAYKEKDCSYYAEDLDPICAKMTALNMVLHGLRGEVVCHDTLCGPDKISFGFHTNSLFHYRVSNIPHAIPITEEQSI